MRLRWSLVLLCLPCVSGFVQAGQPALAENEMTAQTSYDDVVKDLVRNLTRDPTTAQDAAYKLSRMGKRALPVLTDVLKASYTVPPPALDDDKKSEPAKKVDKPETPAEREKRQLAYYSALALSKIKLADAALPLLPILQSDRAEPLLRLIAVEALGLEFLPEAGAVLQKVAAGDADLQLRYKAYGQLMIMPNFWIASEKLFVDALSDPDDEIRGLAAKQCMYARVYLTAADKLIAMAEREPLPAVRNHAMLALARMRVTRAVPALYRVATSGENSAGVQQAALRTLNQITGMTFKDVAAMQNWWTRLGEKEFAKLEAAGVTTDSKPAATQAAVTPPEVQPQAEK